MSAKEFKNGLEIEYVKKLQENCFTDDKEVDHGIADDILCQVLRKLGYNELVNTYERVGKWYA